MFKFGQNWASFSPQLDEARIEEATTSLTSLFGESALKENRFWILDAEVDGFGLLLHGWVHIHLLELMSIRFPWILPA